MVDTIQDYVDRLGTATKWRSHQEEPLRTHDARYLQDGTPIYDWNDTDSALGWHQQTSSIEHAWGAIRRGHKKRPRNIGGPFITTKLEVTLPGRTKYYLSRNATSGWLSYLCEGDLLPHIDVHRICKAIYEDTIRLHSVWTEDNAMNSDDLRIKGEEIMLSLVPTSAAFDAVTAIGEPIADGAIFGLPGRSLIINHDPGGEYLNTVFAVQPTLQDLENLNKAFDTYTEVIKQYHRDADRLIRRRFKPIDLPEVVTTSSFATNPVTAKGRALSANLCSNSTGTITKRINRKIWYSGAFMYHIPKDMSAFETYIYDFQRAFKIAPDPVDLWNLLPFSWLADYFTTGQNTLRHLFLQTAEGAVQVYGYVMCTTVVETTYKWQGMLRINNQPTFTTMTATVQKTIKQRSRVSPFGIHFTGLDLTQKQLFVLAALGIAK